MKRNWLVLFFVLFSVSVSAQEKLTVFFDFDRYILNVPAVDTLQSWISTHPQAEVLKIHGYCDWKGNNAYNDSLSVKRVNSVYDFLVKKGVKVRPDYEMRGFGEDFEQSKEQSKNRKVTIVYGLPAKSEPLPKIQNTLLESVKSAKSGDVIKLDNINFFNMSPRILPRSKSTLFDLACAMEENPNLKIEIQGHICCQKDDKADLSTMRAKAIYNYLISKKINRKRISYRGFGVSRPIHPIPEKSPLQEEENRRVEILILEK